MLFTFKASKQVSQVPITQAATQAAEKHKTHIMVYDPIAFSGGSKKATVNMLNLLADEVGKVTVYSANPTDWQALKVEHTCIKLQELSLFSSCEQGVGYFIKHGLLSLQLLWLSLRIDKPNLLIATSGPGVDYALYKLKCYFVIPLLQLVQGPVATSKSIARCLVQADHIAYLPSCLPSLHTCLNTKGVKAESILNQASALQNGLSKDEWPETRYQNTDNLKLLWTASLLKWKGLDTLVEALKLFSDDKRPETSICYIQPKNCNLACSEPNQNIVNVSWHEKPTHLNTLRKQHQIFVSTSQQEPFGLAILEAMAAGLVVVIPKDGAHWDQVLTHKTSCLKYQPNNAVDLKHKLEYLAAYPQTAYQIGLAGQKIAEQYRAEKTYLPLAQRVLAMASSDHQTPLSALQTDKGA